MNSSTSYSTAHSVTDSVSYLFEECVRFLNSSSMFSHCNVNLKTVRLFSSLYLLSHTPLQSLSSRVYWVEVLAQISSSLLRIFKVNLSEAALLTAVMM